MQESKECDPKMLLQQIKQLNAVPRGIYPEIYDRLNSWEWHPALGEAPEGWDGMTWQEKRPYIQEWMGHIKSKCSEKELLRYHHIHNLNRSEQQFDDWWDSYVLDGIIEELHERPIMYNPAPATLALSFVATLISLIAIVMQLC